MFHFKSSPTLCYCIDVDEKTIVDAINDGADTLTKVKEMTRACTGNECAEKNPSAKEAYMRGLFLKFILHL